MEVEVEVEVELEVKEGEEEPLATERDWTDIPSDLLHLIADRLPDFLDLIYFNATCKAWNLPVPLSHATPCHPWLFDSYKSSNSSFNFYSFTSSTMISIPSSKFNPDGLRNVYSTSLGYLLSHQHGTTSYSLINPLIGTETVLPPLEPIIEAPSHPPRVLRAQDGFGLAMMSYDSDVLSYRLDLHWCKNSEKSPDSIFAYWCITDRHALFEFYNGEFFINDGVDDATSVLDPNTGDYLYEVEEPLFDNISSPSNDEISSQRRIYLVESSGELLKILSIVYERIENPNLCRYLFFLYRLENEGAYSCWVEMGGIGDRAIFLNQFDGFSLRSNEYPILRKNCIYFIKPMTKRVNEGAAADNLLNDHHTVTVASRYDLETGSVDDFPHIMKGWGSWFLPKHH